MGIGSRVEAGMGIKDLDSANGGVSSAVGEHWMKVIDSVRLSTKNFQLARCGVVLGLVGSIRVFPI